MPRALTAGDLPAALGLSQAVQWSHIAADWELAFRTSRGVAIDDAAGQLAGTALWWPWGEHFATIGLVIVRADRQGQGLGRQLMDAVMEAAGPRTLQLVATLAGRPLYERLGFVAQGGIVQVQGAARCAPVPPPAGVALRAVTAADLPVLQALDAAAFGAPRERLIEAILARGQAGMLAEQGGRPTGFALRRASGRGQMIGPVIAPDEHTALALVAPLLGTTGVFCRLDLPADAVQFEAALRAAGLAAADRVVTMRRGPAPPAEARLRVLGLASQAYN